MPLPASGPISLSQLQTEFGGINPISLSEYYRSGANVPNGAQNFGVPTSGAIRTSNFRSTSKTVVVTYEIIGGGGAGGYGLEDGSGSGRGGSGGNSSITGPSINITAVGAIGGLNGGVSFADGPSRTGQSSFYGAGGTGGGNGFGGGAAPASNYGAGGGGAGGDSPNTYDSSGNAGGGGSAGTRLNGTFTVVYGTQVTATIGAGGTPTPAGVYRGGAGAPGFCRISYDGVTLNITSTQAVTII